MYGRSKMGLFRHVFFYHGHLRFEGYDYLYSDQVAYQTRIGKAIQQFCFRTDINDQLLYLFNRNIELYSTAKGKNLLHLQYEIDQLDKFWVDCQAFILMAAVIYVIATILKKGIELQNEQDLTVYTRPIIVNLNVMMAKRKMSLNELSEKWN